MNKIFKVIWSKSKQCYIVVSEMAKNHSGKKKVVVASILAAMAVGSETAVVEVQAGAFDGGQIGSYYATAIGYKANAFTDSSIAIGTYSYSKGTQVPGDAGSTVDPSIAIGNKARAVGNSALAVGMNATADNSFGVAVGRNTEVTGDYGVGIGFKSKAALHGIGIGEQARALKEGATTLGVSSRGYGKGAIAIGWQSLAGADVYTAGVPGNDINKDSSSKIDGYNNWGDMSVGLRALATGGNATALGRNAAATAANAVAIGGGNGNSFNDNTERTLASGEKSAAIGYNSAASGTSASALGTKASASAENAAAIGTSASASAKDTFAAGSSAAATAEGATAVGKAAKAQKTDATALGSGATASEVNATALGKGATASKGDATAVGSGAKATEVNAIAIGKGSEASKANAIAIGKEAEASEVSSTAIGEGANAEKANAVAIGKGAISGGTSGVAVGNDAQAQAADTIAVGSSSRASNANDSAFGNAAQATGGASTAIGYTVNASGDQSFGAGSNTSVSGTAAVGIGYQVTASGNRSISIGADYQGKKTTASAAYTVAMGTGAQASATSAVAIGTNASAGLEHSVALGEGSTTTSNDGTATIGYLTNESVSNSGNGVIAIGNKRNDKNANGTNDTGNILRRIVGLASGTNDYDAANIKQLKALESNERHIKAKTGNDAYRPDATGKITLNYVNGKGADVTGEIAEITDVAKKSDEWMLRTQNGTTTADATPQTISGLAKKAVTLKAGDNIAIENSNGTVTIKAKDVVTSITSGNNTALTVSPSNGAVTITPNIASAVGANGDDGKLVTSGIVKTALDAKIDKTAEMHIKTGEYTVGTDGTASLIQQNGNNQDLSTRVTIKDIAKKSVVDGINTTVNTHTTQISDLTSAVGGKVSQSDFDTFKAKAITFTGDDNAGVARTLDTTLTVKGGANYTSTTTNTNIRVEKDGSTGASGLVVKLSDKLSGMKEIAGDGKTDLVIKNGTNTVTITPGKTGDNGTVNFGNAKVVASNLEADITYRANGVADTAANTVKLKKGLNFTAATDANVTTDGPKSGLSITTGADGLVTFGLDKATRSKVDNAVDKNLSNLSDDGKGKVTELAKAAAKEAVKVAPGINTTVDTDTTTTAGVTTYKVNANDTTVAVSGTELTIDGGTPDATTKIRAYTLGLSDATKGKLAAVGNLATVIGGTTIAENGTVTGPTFNITKAEGGTETANTLKDAIDKLNATNAGQNSKISETAGKVGTLETNVTNLGNTVTNLGNTVTSNYNDLSNKITQVGTNVTTTLTTKGLDFTGNDTTAKVHRDLGSTLTIQGAENFTRAATETTNIKVVKNNDALDVKLAENLANIKEIAGDGTHDLVIKNGDTKVTVKAPKDGNSGSIDFGDTKLVASNLDASIKYRANDEAAGNAKSVKLADGFNYVASNDATTTAEGPKSGLAIKAEDNGKVTFGLDKDTRSKVDNAADKNLSNLSDDGKEKVKELAKTAAQDAVKVAPGINTTVTTDTTTTAGVTTYKVNANDTTIAVSGAELTIDGGTPDATTKIRAYTLGLSDATKGKLAAVGNLANVIGGTAIATDGTVTGPTFNITKADGNAETAKTLKDAIEKLDTANAGQNTKISETAGKVATLETNVTNLGNTVTNLGNKVTNLGNTVTSNYNDLSNKITEAGTNVSTTLTTKGLDFTGNDTTAKVHRDLGTVLTIQGAENFTRAATETNNIKVLKNNDALDVKLAENLANIKEIAGDGTHDLVIKNGDTKVTVKAPKDGNTGSIDFGDTKLVASNLDASIKYRANDDAVGNAKSVKLADGFNYVASNDVTTTAEGPKSGLAIKAEDNGKVTFGLDKTTRSKVDNAADKNLSNLSDDGKDKVKELAKTAAQDAVKVAPGINTTVTTDTTTTAGVTTYKVNANDTTVAVSGTELTIDGGTPDATTKIRAYTLGLSDATKGKLAAVGNLATVIGGTTIAADGSVTGPTFNITKADGNTETAKTLKDAIEKLDAANAGQNTKISETAGKVATLETNVTNLGNTVTSNYNDLSNKITQAGTNLTTTLTTKGLDFTGNDTTANVHRDLGTTLTIKGAENFTRAATETNNIKVVKNNDALDVKLAENLANIKEIAGDGTHDLVIKNGDTKITVEAPKDGNKGVVDLGDAKLKVSDLDANISYKAGTETAKNKVKLQDGFNFVAGTGTVASKQLEAGTASPTATTDNVVTKKGVVISTAADGVVNIGLDSDTRGAIDNAASKDYVATELANLNNTITGNANLNFAGNVTKNAQDADVDKVGLSLATGTLHVNGLANEITTTAKGDTITVELAQTVKDQLAKVGDTASNGRDGANGLTGKDGLNDKTVSEKVNALRNGEAGTVVYTDDAGERLVKANDGKYYHKDDLKADGTPKTADENNGTAPKAVDNPQARVVNAHGDTKTATTLSNIADGKVVAGSKEAVNGGQLHTVKSDLATALGGDSKVNADGSFTGPTYNITKDDGSNTTEEVKSVGDAISKLDTRINNANASLGNKGLDFYGNKDAADTDKVHRNLGEALKVKGAENFTRAATATNNITVVKNAVGDGLDVKLAENLGNMKGISGNGTDSLVIKNGDATMTLTPAKPAVTDPATGDETTPAKPATVDFGDSNVVAKNLDASITYRTNNAEDANAKSVKLKQGLNFVAATDATTTVEGPKSGLAIATEDNGKVTFGLDKDTRSKVVAVGNLATVIGGTAIAADGTVTGPTFNITKADGTSENATTLKDAIEKLDTANKDQNTNITNLGTRITNLVDGGMTFVGDDATADTVTRKLGETLNIHGQNNISVKKAANSKDTVNVTLASELKNITSITNADADGKPGSKITLGADGVSIANTVAGQDGAAGETKTVTIGKDGIDAGNMKITNVAEATENGDATNKQYVDTAISNLKDTVTKNANLRYAGDTNEGADADKTYLNLPLATDTLKVAGTAGEIKTVAKAGTITLSLEKAVTDKLAQLGDTTSNGRDGANGLTGADGQNGKTVSEKVNALRNGEAGTVVYTDDAGERLVKANDGKYYHKDDLKADGTPKTADENNGTAPKAVDNPQARVVNANGDVKTATTLSNIADGKVVAGSKEAVNGGQLHTVKSDLATALGGDSKVNADGSFTGPTYNITKDDGSNTTEEVKSVGDAISKLDTRINNANASLGNKGLDFYGNKDAADTDKVHRNLGEALKVKGAENFTRADGATNNIDVVKNAAGNGLDVKLAENLGNIKKIAGDGTHDLVIKNGDANITLKPAKPAVNDPATGDEITPAKPATVDFGDSNVVAKNLDASITYRANNDTDENAKSVKLKQGLNFVASDVATTTEDGPKSGLVIKAEDDGKVTFGLDTATREKVDNAADKNLSNLSEAGNNKITNLAKAAAKETVKVANGINTTVDTDTTTTEGVTTYKVNANDTKVAVAGDGLTISGGDLGATDRVRTYTLDLSDATKGKLAAVGNLANVIGGTTIAADGTVTGPTFTITKADGTGENATTLKEAIEKLDAANQGQNEKITNLGNSITEKGLDFYGNKDAADTDKVHRNLGEALKVKGAENFTRADGATNNIDVVKNAAGNGLDVKLAENLGNIKKIAGDGTHDLVIKNGDANITLKPAKPAVNDPATGDEITPAKPATVDFGDSNVVAKNLDASITYRANNDTDENAKSVKLKQGLNFVAGTGTVAPKHLEAGTPSPTATTDSVEPKKGIAISTAENGVVNIGLDSDTRSAIDNAANQDLSNLTTAGKQVITDAAQGAVKVAAGNNVTIDTTTKDNVTTYTVNGRDTTVKAATGGSVSVTGGNLNAKGGREYTVDLTDAAKAEINRIAGIDTRLTAAEGNITTLQGDMTKAKADIAGNTQAINNNKQEIAKNAGDIKNLQGNSATKDLSNLTNAGKDVVTGLVNVVGTNGITVTSDTDTTSRVKTFTAKLDDKVTFGQGDKQITVDGTKGTISVGNNGSVNIDGTTGTVTAKHGNFGTISGLSNTTWNPSAVTGTDRSVAATQGQVKDVSDTLQKGRVFTADTGATSAVVALGETLAIKGGAQGAFTDNNIGVELSAGTDKTPVTMTVRLAKDVKMKDGSTSYNYYLPEVITKPDGTKGIAKNADGTVKYQTDKEGNPISIVTTTVNGEGITITPVKGLNKPSVSLTADGLDNGGNAIHHVAPGTAADDAATFGQVVAAASTVSRQVNQTGAHAAALAAMNPLSYDPLKKSQVMAGYGAYKGNSALALGVAHYANEDTLFNVGVSVGNGENMVNAGITYRFGGEDSMIPERYKGGPISSVYVMQDEITALKAENARKDAENAKKDAESEEMKAQIKMLIERVTMLEAKK